VCKKREGGALLKPMQEQRKITEFRNWKIKMGNCTKERKDLETDGRQVVLGSGENGVRGGEGSSQLRSLEQAVVTSGERNAAWA